MSDIPRWWTVIAVRPFGQHQWTDMERPAVERATVPSLISAGHIEGRVRRERGREVYEVRAINGGGG